jgi:hypothetical protein
MFGPEYNTIGSPTYNTANTLVKADGGHHLLDSNITDDGSTVSIGADVSITGGLVSTGSSVNLVSTIPGNFQLQKAIQYPSVDSVRRGHTYGENFIGMMDYSAVATRYDKSLVMIKGVNSGFAYTGIVYNSGYDVGFFLDTPSGSIARFSLETDEGDGVTRGVWYAKNMDIAGLANNTDQINIGNSTVVDINTIAGTEITFDAPSVQITGSLSYNGPSYSGVTALSISSQTASLDADSGDFYTLDLVNGSDTLVEIGNRAAGQTFILKTTQPASGTGTISFFGAKFSDGTVPSATATSNAIDIYTFVTFDDGDAFATQVTNLQ